MVDVAHRAPHRLHDAVEMSRGRAVRGARIDDQEGFQRVPCASQRARTETTSVAPRAAAQAGLEVTPAPPNSAPRSPAIRWAGPGLLRGGRPGGPPHPLSTPPPARARRVAA